MLLLFTFIIVTHIYTYFDILKKYIASELINFIINNAHHKTDFNISENRRHAIINVNSNIIYVPYSRDLISDKMKITIINHDFTIEKLKIKKGVPLLVSPNDLGVREIRILRENDEIVLIENQRFIDFS
jgi:hypothetical protein